MKNSFKEKVFWIILIIIIWEVVSKLNLVSPLLLPSFSTVIVSLIFSVKDGEILKVTGYSLYIIFKGMIIGTILGMIFSAFAVKWKIFNSFLQTLISIMHPLPGVALLPLIILWFGVGENAILFIIVHSVIWPLIVNILAGFKSIPENYIAIGENYQLKFREKILRIYLPSSFPFILSGIKIGFSRAWRALISAEMIFGAASSIGGLGYFIFTKRVYMDTPGMFSGLILVIITGILIEEVLIKKIEINTIEKWGR